MKAWCVEHNRLVFQNTKPPILRTNTVRIKTRAIGLNRADLLQIQGYYPSPEGVRNDILGLECSGTVVEVSSEVSQKEREYWLGREVMALVAGEAYAAEVVVDIGHLMPRPQSVSVIDSAGIPEAFLTAFDALWRQASLREHHRVLIHAIASGVGDAARQLCLSNGNAVTGTSRSIEKCKRLSTASTPVFHIEEGRFPSGLSDFDLVLDFIGASYLKQNLHCLSKGGHLQLIGLLGGLRGEINLGVLLSKHLTVRGTTLRSRTVEEKSDLVQDFQHRFGRLFECGTLYPQIDSTYSWKDVEQAQLRMSQNKNVGKIILVVD